MRIRADRSVGHVVPLGTVAWVASPMPGVWRRMLERVGEEAAVATSVVRYDAGSRFSAHTHHGGEEFLVLEGVFSDQHGDFGVGTYVRNPVGSSHAPFTEQGCTILVKLRQMPASDGHVVVHDAIPAVPGERVLHDDPGRGVVVKMARRAAGDAWSASGAEVLVVSGRGRVEGQVFAGPTWIRVPPGEEWCVEAEDEVVLWSKEGHLVDPW